MYEAYFGLAKLPFSVAPDSQLYVDTDAHRAAIQALKDRLQRGDEFVSLIGDHGSGKTMVGHQLLREMDRRGHLVAELPRHNIEGDQLFDRVAEAFGSRRAGGLPPLGSVVRQLENLVRGGRDALLLVDDAHRLDTATLRRLRKLTAIRVEGEAALRVCLVGNAMPLDFEAMQPAGRRPNSGTPVRVGPLDAAGTHEYIITRLGHVGWWGRPAFDAATEAIHGRCRGSPLYTNRLCDHILLHLYMQRRDHVTADDVRVVDDLLQFELRGEVYGEPVTIELPLLEALEAPEAPVPEPAPAPASPGLDTDALMSRLIGKPLPGLPAPDSGFSAATPSPASPQASPPPPESAPQADGRRTKPRRPGMAQGVAAVALLASGGLLSQMIPNTSAHGSVPRQAVAPQANAAGLAALAEQALSQSPTGAGTALQAASPEPRLLAAALSPASGPRSSPPTR